jgi:hypothetical protein
VRGECPECHTYRIDGNPPYLHREWCSKYGDLQMDRWLKEVINTMATPPNRCTECGTNIVIIPGDICVYCTGEIDPIAESLAIQQQILDDEDNEIEPL